DIRWHAFQRHHRTRAGLLGDLGLLGVGDVHDHAALKHLGQADLYAPFAGPGVAMPIADLSGIAVATTVCTSVRLLAVIALLRFHLDSPVLQNCSLLLDPISLHPKPPNSSPALRHRATAARQQTAPSLSPIPPRPRSESRPLGTNSVRSAALRTPRPQS